MGEKLTTEIFIKRAVAKHGNRFNYSKVDYKNKRTEIIIGCPIHGEFWQTPPNHLNGKGCSECSGKAQYTNENFIEKVSKIHNFKYDYSKAEYINNQTKVCIICPIHGEFWQGAGSHLKGYGCQKCANNFLGDETFIKRAIEKHGSKYDYSKVIYKQRKIRICIICPKHGEFWQTPEQHLSGGECPKCVGHFIEKAVEKHGNKYDYSKVDYTHSKKSICIICLIHGEFWQIPNYHLSGHGCPHCNESTLEKEVKGFLQENNIYFETQKRFKWFGRQRLDFYLPDYTIAVECQGGQHFQFNKHFHRTQDKFTHTQELDKNKYELCQKHNIKILYFTNKQYFKYNNGYLGNLIYNKQVLLKEILTVKNNK